MPQKTSPVGKTVSKKPAQKTDASKTRALEEQLAQRDAEIARLFADNQRLLKDNEQRATELQIVDNIGQILTEGLDLNSAIKRAGDRVRDALKLENIAITIADMNKDQVIAQYFHSNRSSFSAERFSKEKFNRGMRLSMRGSGRSWIVNKDAEKRWRKFSASTEEHEFPKSFIILPLLSGKDAIGGITIADYQKENAFADISISLLETIASNFGTAIQNARLFDETQRLLKETDQRATELQVINNIGQTLTEGLDLKSTLERVGDRLREALKVKSIGIIANDIQTGLVISAFVYLKGKRVIPDRYSLSKNMLFMRFVERTGGKPVVINTNVEKNWRKFLADSPEWAEIPKAFVMVPLLAAGELVGSITIPDYEREDAFTDLPINMLETIASNMGTAIQNVRLFDETQRLLKQTEQRATELQIINNVGQMLTEGLDLQSTLERVGERLREVLKVESIGIIANDTRTGFAISHYVYLKGVRIIPNRFSLGKNLFGMRFAARVGGKPLVVNSNVEKNWRKFVADVPEYDEIPKSFVLVPLLASKELVGSITIADYEDENAFVNLPLNLLETIASNMGTAIQNVRLFDETQRLLKETEQRATELQIINNIGQTLTEGLDLNTTLERVGERLREALNIKSLGIVVFDPQAGLAISNYFYHYDRQFTPQRFSMSNYKLSIRLASRLGNKPFVVNTNAERYWKKFLRDILPDWTKIPKAFVVVPLLAGGELVGSITIGDYERENAFSDLSVNLLETIASNMGTAIQNVRLFDETKKLFSEAEEARAAAEQANKAKSTFLANMSHELRTPLNAIMGFTQIVRGKGEGVLPEKQLDNLDKVTSSSQHLLGLINTVLDIAKIEAGRMEVLPARFKLNNLADQCANLAAPLLKPGITLEKQVDESIGVIYSDQDKIKQIVLNLLSNAAKFTHAGKIILNVEKLDDKNVAISVKDSGIGISEEAVGRVFEEFQQADNTTTRQYGGTGLGLTISRNLARLLGGDLTATSELGKGSTFTLTIPINYKIDNASSSDLEPDSVQPAESNAEILSTEERAEEARAKTILIVEDTELNINLLAQLLEDDYKLLFAKDGAQGVGMAQHENPDLILMDISLPIMDGYEATRRIRANMISVPIIGLSAYAMTGDADKAKEAGCNDYVTKPINKDILLNKIKDYLR